MTFPVLVAPSDSQFTAVLVGAHSTRKTLARKVYTWSNDIRVVQRILGHRSLTSTEAYLKSLTDREVWTVFRTAAA